VNPRLPAEWEIQDGALMACRMKDRLGLYADDIRPVFAEIIKHITRFEKVLLTAPHAASATGTWKRQVLTCPKLQSVKCQTMIPGRVTWTCSRYYSNKPTLLDFGFNGWLKFPANHDNLISKRLRLEAKAQSEYDRIV
jgi:agmatine/peptidylarginine deiminase